MRLTSVAPPVSLGCAENAPDLITFSGRGGYSAKPQAAGSRGKAQKIMLPRSKSKQVAVDHDRFRYLISESGKTENGVVSLIVTVQHCTENGARLRVVGLKTHRVPEASSKFYRGRTVDPALQPRDVVELIKLGISRGWVPKLPGPAFILRVESAYRVQLMPEG
jgi:hypothetical protein